MSLQCEVCGSSIHGSLKAVLIDGGTFRVCNTCAKLGTPLSPQRKTMPPMIKPSPMIKPKASQRPPIEEELELRRDFHNVIRQARQKMGLSQEELGRKINEKPSVIKLLESSKLKPDKILTRKIEHFLRVEIMVPSDTEL